MTPADLLLADLCRVRRIGYAEVDRHLIVGAVGGCRELWGEAHGSPLTDHMPELLGMRAATG